jgi:hypothetical protein
MQFQVPQFIETEDKIVGPLTLKQFVYMGAAAGIDFLLFFALETWLWFIFAFIITALGVGLAFIKINGRPLVSVILSALKFYWSPQTFVWQQDHKDPNFKKREIPLSAEPKKSSFSIQGLISGLALKNKWQKVQTGEAQKQEKSAGGPVRSPHQLTQQLSQKIKDRYQIFEKMTGDRQAARRVDYR